MKPGGAVDVGCTCPDTLQPCFGNSLILTFFDLLFEIDLDVTEVVSPCCRSFGRLYISAGIAEVFQVPMPSCVCCEVLIIVATRNAILRRSMTKGKVSQPHSTLTYVSGEEALPMISSLLLASDLTLFVMACATLSMWWVTLLGASHGLKRTSWYQTWSVKLVRTFR